MTVREQFTYLHIQRRTTEPSAVFTNNECAMKFVVGNYRADPLDLIGGCEYSHVPVLRPGNESISAVSSDFDFPTCPLCGGNSVTF
jgi:hypothetical protein